MCLFGKIHNSGREHHHKHLQSYHEKTAEINNTYRNNMQEEHLLYPQLILRVAYCSKCENILKLC